MQQATTHQKTFHVVGFGDADDIREVAAMPIEMLPEPRVPSALEVQVDLIVKIVLAGYERNTLRFGLVDALEPIPAKERFTTAEFVVVDELADDASARFIASLECEEEAAMVHISNHPIPPLSQLDLAFALAMLSPPESPKEEIARLLAG